MARPLFFPALILIAAALTWASIAAADDTPTDKYNLTGSVLSAVDKHGHFYQVGTDSRVYLLLCTKVKTIQFGAAECKIGDKPIATGDTVHFRIDGDWAYMTPVSSESMEQKLRILTTELKVIPPLPAASAPATAAAPAGKGSSPSPEPGVVIGTGTHVKGQSGLGWSTNPYAASPLTTGSPATSVMATAPVTAIPVTGGPPVVVVPVAPTTGGVITGVPVTGGAPITAIPVAPVTGVPIGGPAPAGGPVIIGGGAPQWVHVLRIQTDGNVYQLECSSKPCTLGSKEIALGDSLNLRVDKKHAYLSSGSQTGGDEQEYKILSVTDTKSSPPESKPH